MRSTILKLVRAAPLITMSILIFLSDQKQINTKGTYPQGYVNVVFRDIYPVLGDPLMLRSGDNVEYRWVIEFEDYIVATIYNRGNHPSPRSISSWEVGGYGPKALAYVKSLLTLSSGKPV